MKYRPLTKSDIINYSKDLLKCYNDNKLIFDCQNPILITYERDIIEFLLPYVEGCDSYIIGIFDDNEKFLYGVVIFDNVRCVDLMVAEIHIAISKEIWGRIIKDLFDTMIKNCLPDILYCQIPQIATHAIGMVRRMGFKKTGYIPKALPYKNAQGITNLYDLNIFVYQKDKEV